MARIDRAGVQGDLGPKMNPVMTPEYWYKKSAADGNLAPQRKLDNEKPKGETIAYEDLIKSWSAPDTNKG